MIVAADVFCYFGDLAPILALCAPHELIFSVEINEDAATFSVQPNGRYQHHPAYVEELLQKAGYAKIERHRLVLRQENGADVWGIIFKVA